jgi:hypothetical protein
MEETDLEDPQLEQVASLEEAAGLVEVVLYVEPSYMNNVDN